MAIRSLGLFIAFVFSLPAFSADYYWFVNNRESLGYFPSALQACQAYLSYYNESNNDRSATIQTFTSNSSNTTYTCRLLVQLPSGGTTSNTQTVVRRGDACPAGEIFDVATGGCKPPSQCESKKDQNTTWSMLRPDLNGLGPIEYGCEAGCRIALGTSECAPVSEGATTGVCWGVGKFTGAECQAGDNPTGGTPPPDPTDPTDPTDPPPECGPGHSWSGTTCVPDEPEECDPSTGEVCPPDDGDGEDGDGEDGDGDGEGDGDGDGEGDGEGDGDGDGDGDGEGDGTGDGEGDGDSECDPKTDPNKCVKPSVEGEACDTELKCEGDVIQCAILRANKNQICQWQYDDQIKRDIENELVGEDYQLEEKSIPVSGLFTEAVNKGRWLPQSCPSPQSFSVMGRSYSFSWEPACRFAQAIGPLIVALASIFFAVSIGRGIKGS